MLKLEKRGSNSLRRWWWMIDNITMILMLAIILIGALLITTASPPVAERLKLPAFYFVHRQFLFLVLAVFTMLFISTLEEKTLKRISLLGFVGCIFLMIIVLFIGDEVKGARRWLNIAGVSIQPSEIIKPFFVFLVGSLLAEKYNRKNFPGFTASAILHALVCVLLILQPDFGMVITFTIVMAGQFFLAGLPVWWIGLVFLLGSVGAFLAYNFLPHVAKRIDSFLNPDINENYQVEKSLESYANGGLFGRGPGEGTVKSSLPDSHTDFIFAVAGEEFGAFFAMIIMLVFLAFILRGFYKLYNEHDLAKIYIGGGILILFTLQTIFNIGVTLHLFPTKGMTLPFVSYGGSSIISFALSFGIFLNLTKRVNVLNFNKNRMLNS